MSDLVGKTLGKYPIRALIDRGGMSEVYEAYHPGLDRRVAIKVLHSHIADQEGFLERFRREATTVASLRHSNIVQVHDFDSEGDLYYMVMELIEGPTLKVVLRERRDTGPSASAQAPGVAGGDTIKLTAGDLSSPPSPERLHPAITLAETARIFSELASALDYAHLQGLVHRDLKPANIMFTAKDRGQVVLTDFGIVHIVGGARLTEIGGPIGTVAYMSPEHCRGQQCDARSDIYSLGVILYEMVTGQLPFDSASSLDVMMKHVDETVPLPTAVNPNVPKAVEHVILKALEKNPAARYRTAGDMADALQEAIKVPDLSEPSPLLQPTPEAGEKRISVQAVDTDSEERALRQDSLTELRKILAGRFSEDGLRTLCFDLGVDYDDLPGQGKVSKARELVRHLEHRNRILELVEIGKQLRPDISWPELQKEPSGEVFAAPFLAPRDIPQFVGRKEELIEFCGGLARSTGQNVHCFVGMGGIGKTALAIHAAHTLRSDFPDGVLWANVATSEPLAILDSWARAYDCDFSGLPDLESRAVALRGLLADKNTMMILDDVWRADQVRPLLPGGPQCTVLLTTQNLELAVALDAHVYLLSVLTPLESRHLMSRIVGDERVMDEEESADEICQLLGYLPLAVEIAAKRLKSRPRWKLAEMAERLRDAKNLLDELKAENLLDELKIGDIEVRASFAVSWEALGEGLRKSFALLAVFEGRAFTAPAFAAVAEMDVGRAENHLDSLVALSLVSEEGAVHYRQHSLLAIFARERLGQDETAYARMVQYYLGYATEHQHDYVELEQEWGNLLAGIRVAYQRKMWRVVIDYSEVLADAWFARGRFSDMRQGYQWACEAAEALEDRPALASGLCQWGRACIEQGDYTEAEEHLSHSLQIYKELDDQPGIASAQYYRGRIAIEKANFEEAQQLLMESQRIRKQLGDVAGVAETLSLRAHGQNVCRNLEEAESLAKQALDMQQAVGYRLGCIRTLNLLALVALRQDNHGLTEGYCQRALTLCEEIQEQGELAITLYYLSEALRRRGDLGSARDHAERSLALLIRMGDRKSQARVLLRLSFIDADRKKYDLALEEGLHSLNLRRELKDTWGTVYHLFHLGDVYQALAQPDRAHEIRSEALSLAEALGHPLTESLRERLSAKV